MGFGFGFGLGFGFGFASGGEAPGGPAARWPRYGEIWGDMGRYGEIWGDMGEERLVARLRDGRVDVELVDDVVGLVPPGG